MAKTTTKTAAAQHEEPIGRWAELLAETKLIEPYQITSTITISVPGPERATEIRNADMTLSMLRLKLAELLIEKGRETEEARALNTIRDKLADNPGDLTSQELSTLTAAIVTRRNGVPEDLFEQVAEVSAGVNERLERALFGDQYDAVKAYLAPQNYDVADLLINDVKATLIPSKHLPKAAGKDNASSVTSNGTGTQSNPTSSTAE